MVCENTPSVRQEVGSDWEKNGLKIIWVVSHFPKICNVKNTQEPLKEQYDAAGGVKITILFTLKHISVNKLNYIFLCRLLYHHNEIHHLALIIEHSLSFLLILNPNIVLVDWQLKAKSEEERLRSKRHCLTINKNFKGATFWCVDLLLHFSCWLTTCP